LIPYLACGLLVGINKRYPDVNWPVLIPDPAQINWLAILVAALTAFAAAAIWYTVFFGQSWLRHHQVSPVRQLTLGSLPAVTFSLMLLAYAAMATVLEILILALDIATPLDGAALGLLIGLGIAVFITLVENRLQKKSLFAFFIDGSFQVIVLTLMGAIVASWP